MRGKQGTLKGYIMLSFIKSDFFPPASVRVRRSDGKGLSENRVLLSSCTEWSPALKLMQEASMAVKTIPCNNL